MRVVALVRSRLDYGNAVLVGIPAYLMRRLQSELNAAARLIYTTCDHTTTSQMRWATLHWLRVPELVQYRTKSRC